MRKLCNGNISDGAVHTNLRGNILRVLVCIIRKDPTNCSFSLEQCWKQVECSCVLQTHFLRVTGQRLVPSVRKRCVCYAVLCISVAMGAASSHFIEPFVSIWALPSYILASTVAETLICYWEVTFRSLIIAGRSLSTCLKVLYFVYIYIYMIYQKTSFQCIYGFSKCSYSKKVLYLIVLSFHYIFANPSHNWNFKSQKEHFHSLLIPLRVLFC
jgi:hypothetical protein